MGEISGRRTNARPDGLKRTTYWALVKLCVSAAGDVVSVRIIKPSSSPDFDAALPPVLGRWRYRPYLVNGQPVPFCYTLRYTVHARQLSNSSMAGSPKTQGMEGGCACLRHQGVCFTRPGPLVA